MSKIKYSGHIKLFEYSGQCDILRLRGEQMSTEEYWYRCPKCGYPKMIKYRNDTRLRNFPGYCKRCKKESIITIEPRAK